MTVPLIIVLLIFMGLTAYVLVRGVMAMASGKVGNQEKQQEWMRKRVLYQGIAIFIAALVLMLARGSH
jgi:Hypoxia induced protein conserved region